MGSDIFIENFEEHNNESILPSYSGEIVDDKDGIIEKKTVTTRTKNDLTEEFGSREELQRHFGRDDTKALHHSIQKGKTFSVRDQQALLGNSSYRGCSGVFDFERFSEVKQERRFQSNEVNDEKLPYHVVPCFDSESGDYIIHFMTKSEGNKPSLGDISFYLKKSLKSIFQNFEEAQAFAKEYGFEITGEDKVKLRSSREAFDDLVKKLEFKKILVELKNRLEIQKNSEKDDRTRKKELSDVWIDKVKDTTISFGRRRRSKDDDGGKCSPNELRFDIPENKSFVSEHQEASEELFFNIPEGKYNN